MIGKNRRRTKPMPPFEFTYRGLEVKFSPKDLEILVDFNITVCIDGKEVILDREESMRFIREYFVYLDKNK